MVASPLLSLQFSFPPHLFHFFLFLAFSFFLLFRKNPAFSLRYNVHGYRWKVRIHIYVYVCICVLFLHIHMCIYMYRVYQVGAKAKTEWNETKRDNASVHLLHLLRTIWCALPLCWTSHNDLLVLLVSIFGVLKRVPLSDRTSRGCQHVGPVSQFCSARVVPQDDLPNGFWGADTIVVDYRDNQLHFLNVKSRISALPSHSGCFFFLSP